WRDNAIGITGADARPLLHCFAQTWRYVIRGGRASRAEYIYDLDVGRRVLHPRMRRVKRKSRATGVLVYAGTPGQVNASTLPAQPVPPSTCFGVLASVPTLSSPLLPFLLKLVRDAR